MSVIGIYRQSSRAALQSSRVAIKKDLRLIHLAIGVLLLSANSLQAQTTEKSEVRPAIVGTVLNEQGDPLKNISVHAVLELTGFYMPTAVSDEAGHFVIKNLKPGTYSIFGENETFGYPFIGQSFYRGSPATVTLGNGGEASIVLVLGPKAGVLRGIALDQATGRPIASQHVSRFIVRRVSNPADSIEFEGAGNFRWLVPSAADLTLEVLAEGYKPWVYAEPSSPSTPTPFRLESGEVKTLNVVLEPLTRQENGSE